MKLIPASNKNSFFWPIQLRFLGMWLPLIFGIYNANANSFYYSWTMGRDLNDNWFDDDNWSKRGVLGGDLGSGKVPEAGDDVLINSDPGYSRFQPADISPNSAEMMEYFKNVFSFKDRDYLMYTCEDIVVANNNGSLRTAVLNIDMRQSITVGARNYFPGIRTGTITLGPSNFGASGGRAHLVNGLVQAQAIIVGENQQSAFQQFGGTLITPLLRVGASSLYEGNGSLVTNEIRVSNSGNFKMRTGTASAAAGLSAVSRGSVTISQATLEVSDGTSSNTVFSISEDSRLDQIGGLIDIKGSSYLGGAAYLYGGIFRSAKATFQGLVWISDTAEVTPGDLQINGGAEVVLLGSGKLNAPSLNVRHPLYSGLLPPELVTTVSVGELAKIDISGISTIGAVIPATNQGFPSPDPTKFEVKNAGALFRSGTISIGQSANAVSVLTARAGGKVSATGELRIGEFAGATGIAESYDVGSEINAQQIWLGKVPGSTSKLVVGQGGSLRATNGIMLGSIFGSANASLLIGGPNPAGGFFLPGAVNSPFVRKAATDSNNYNVNFQHSGSNYNFTPHLQKIDKILHTGPGKSILSGQVQGISDISAQAGTLELSYAQNPIDVQAISIAGGTLVLNGSSLARQDLSLVDVSFTKGEISLINGGKLNAAVNISGNSGSASFLVDGETSLFTPRKIWFRPSLIIGDNGIGKLTAQNFGKILIDPATGPPVILGNGVGGIGTLSILSIGSDMNTGSLIAGKQGRGNIVLNYGALSSTSAVLGSQTGASGSATISNLGSWRIAANTLSVGSSGSGRLTLTSSGSLRIGPTGTGDLILGETESGKGILEIGTGGTPGSLFARRVTTGDTEFEAEVLFRHTASSYNFAPAIRNATIRVADGNLGTTSLTSTDTSVPNIIVTTGGLRVAQGGRVVVNSEVVIGDERTEDMNGGALAFLEIDGAGSKIAADRSIIIGRKANAELRLKNGGIVEVGRPEQLREIILGDQFGIGRVVFGGGGASPGNVSASSIRSVEAGGKVVFDHPATNLIVSAGFSGNLAVEHRGSGTTQLTGNLANTGTTQITAGTLLYASPSNSSAITVSGSGSVGGTAILSRLSLANGGSISPGNNGIGTQRVGILNIAAGAKFRIDLGPNLTCDQIRNNSVLGIYTDMAINPPASGNVTFEFTNRGMNQNGIYPIMRPYTQLTASFLSRLRFTANFPLQGYFQQTFVNGGFGDSYNQLEFVTTGFDTAYAVWARSFSLDPAGIGAPGQDADKDGLQNMVEYVIMSSPVDPKPANMPSMNLSATHLNFSFRPRTGASDLFSSEVEYSNNLRDWTVASPSMTESFTLNTRTFVTASIPRPTDGKLLFARMRVTARTP